MIWMKRMRWLWLHWSANDYGFKPGRVFGFVLFPRDGTGSEPYHALLAVDVVLSKSPRLRVRTAF